MAVASIQFNTILIASSLVFYLISSWLFREILHLSDPMATSTVLGTQWSFNQVPQESQEESLVPTVLCLWALQRVENNILVQGPGRGKGKAIDGSVH